MSTDFALARSRNAQVEANVSNDTLAIVCLWAVVGLVLAALMAHVGFDAEVAAALATAG